MTAAIANPAADHVLATNVASERFFTDNADAIASACQAMAQRFQQGGRMWVCGDGAQRSDVAHVVVEFLHPVVTGKRALPAFALPEIRGGAAQRAVGTLVRSGDILLLLSAGALEAAATDLVAEADTAGLLTLVLCGAGGETGPHARHGFVVPSSDPCVAQETQELLYHILWELVHVFFEHRAVPA